MYYKLIYSFNDQDVDIPYNCFDTRVQAEFVAKKISMKAHEEKPDVVDENGEIFMMDWLGFDKPYYGNESKFVPYITVLEVEE